VSQADRLRWQASSYSESIVMLKRYFSTLFLEP